VDYQGVFGEVRSAAPAGGGLFNRIGRVVRSISSDVRSKAAEPELSRSASVSDFALSSPAAELEAPMLAQSAEAYPMAAPYSPEIDAELDEPNAQLLGETVGVSGRPAPSPSIDRVEIRLAEGLNMEAIALLLQYLQSVQLPMGIRGGLVFEFVVNRGRVSELVWDDQGSSLKDALVVQMIRQALTAWQPDGAIATKVKLVVLIQP
jgi:Ca-activated chloride channel homolog